MERSSYTTLADLATAFALSVPDDVLEEKEVIIIQGMVEHLQAPQA